jgi:endoglucanase
MRPLLRSVFVVTLASGCSSSSPAPAEDPSVGQDAARSSDATPSSDAAPALDATPEAATDVETDRSAPLAFGFGGFRRGINLADALEAPNEGDWGVTLSEEHFILTKRAGFDHVRLTCGFSLHAGTAAPYTIDETFLQRVDWAIDQATTNGLSIVLDLQNYNEVRDSPATESERFLAIWRQVATRYTGRPATVAFDILNEPANQLTAPLWNQLAATAIAAIRETNPDRYIVVEADPWADAASFSGLKLPKDAHVVASFHGYEPKLFASQGSPWMGPEYQTVGIQWPGPPATPLAPSPQATSYTWVTDWLQKYNTLPTAQNPCGPTTIKTEFDAAVRFGTTAGVPVWVGEFAAVDYGDLASRVNWLRDVRNAAELRGMPWAYWDDGGRNKFLDVATSSWDTAIDGALFGP